MIAIVTKVLGPELSAQGLEHRIPGFGIDLHIVGIARVENLEMLTPDNATRVHMAGVAGIGCRRQQCGGYFVIGAAEVLIHIDRKRAAREPFCEKSIRCRSYIWRIG